MTYAALLNTLVSYERQFGAATFGVRGTALVKKHDAIAFDNLFSGDQASIGARRLHRRAAHRADGQRLREGGHRRPRAHDHVQPRSRRTATLERVWLDDPRPRAGRTVPLKVLLRTYRGEDVRAHGADRDSGQRAAARCRCWSPTAPGSAQAEQREARPPQPRSVAQMIRSLNKARRNNTLYVKLLGSDAGAVVNGDCCRRCRRRCSRVLEADRNGGSFNPLHSATLGEWELTTEHAVSGVADADHHRLAELTRRSSRTVIPRCASRRRSAGLTSSAHRGRVNCTAARSAPLASCGRCVLAARRVPLHASSPKFFQAATQADFLRATSRTSRSTAAAS